MDWLDKHMAEGQRIRDELNGTVVAFPDMRIPAEITAINTYEGILRGLAIPVPQLATASDFLDYMLLPSTAEALKNAIIFNIRKARGYYETANQTTN